MFGRVKTILYILALKTFPFVAGKKFILLPLVEIDISLLTSDVGETTTNTLDGSQGNGNLILTVNVGVEQTDNVLEL